jgi:hypothetical protein
MDIAVEEWIQSLGGEVQVLITNVVRTSLL